MKPSKNKTRLSGLQGLPLKLKTTATILGVAALATGSAFWAVKNGVALFPLPTYEVKTVIDGDTFITSEDQYIRLAATEAPELQFCGGEEAKAGLEKLILNQKIQLKVIFRDQYNRLISYVFTPDGSVNQKMLELGLSRYSRPPKDIPAAMVQADDTARSKRLGIYGPKCTQKTNPRNKTCVIKGNVSQQDGSKTYHFPGCGQYNNTIVQLYLGEDWFCTEAEAKGAGFVKGSDCFDKKYL